jgi:NAD(P)-dependent dehydrogenase (short-subunit alcohol dehydrogenase family)
MSWSVEGRTVLITGGNSGIGRATAAALARAGADVTMTTRDPALGATVASELTKESGREVRAMQVDLADSASIESFAERFLTATNDLGVLINNAGVMLGSRRLSADGHEMTFRVNHLGHFHLTCLFSDLLLASAPSRVVTLASSAHYSAKDIELGPSRGPYRGFRTYSRSKLANVLFATELARRLEGTGVRSYAVHPGLVATRLGQDGDTLIPNLLWKLFRSRMLTPEQGALTTVFAATDPTLDEHSGAYLSDERITKPSEPAGDLDLAARLWAFSEEATGCRIT